MKRNGGLGRGAEELSARMGDGMFFADSTKRVTVFVAAEALQRIPAENFEVMRSCYCVPELFEPYHQVRISFRPQDGSTLSGE
jgi:hypothetical protein